MERSIAVSYTHLYVEEVAKANNAKIAIKGFVRMETGEGIEKKEEDLSLIHI